MLTPKVYGERRRAKHHPLVVATLKAEQEIRQRFPWKRDWPLAIQEQIALVGLEKGRVFADRVGYGLRSRLGLVHEAQCSYVWGDGHQCHEAPRHPGDHACACGKCVARATPYQVAKHMKGGSVGSLLA